MLNYLENLRNKPESERRKSVFMISFCVTLFIALLWIGSQFLVNRPKDLMVESAQVKEDMPDLKETFSSFFGTVKRIFDNSAIYENSPEETNEFENMYNELIATSTNEETSYGDDGMMYEPQREAEI